MTDKTYQLRTIGDLLSVPADRRAACFRDLEYALSLHELAFGDEAEPSQIQTLTWTDDDLSNVSLCDTNNNAILSLEVTRAAAQVAGDQE